MEMLTSGVTPVRIQIDQCDFERLSRRKVSVGSHGYAQLWDGNLSRLLLVHRWVLGLTEKTGFVFVVDHINRDRLDCRRENLRVVSPSESNLNRQAPTRKYPLGIYPVPSGRFAVGLKRQRRQIYCGTYDSVAEAVRARDEFLNEVG